MTSRSYMREVEPVIVDDRTSVGGQLRPRRLPVQREIVVTKTATYEVVEEIRITETPEYHRRERIIRASSAPWRFLLSRVVTLMWVFAAAAAVLLAFRITLQLLGVGPLTGVLSAIYRATDWLLLPFAGLLSSPAVGPGILNLPALIAIFVYTAVAFLLIQLTEMLYVPALRPASQRRITTPARDL